MRHRHLETSLFGDPADHLDPKSDLDRAVAPGLADPATDLDRGDSQNPGLDAAGVAAVAHVTRSSTRHRRAELRRKQDVRRVVVLLLALALVAGAGTVATLVLRPVVSSLTASKDYTGNGSGAVSVEVHGGDTGRAIGAVLEKAGVVKTAKAFSDAAADSASGGSIQPGTYALRGHMSAASALAMLLDPVNRTVPRVTIREGLWVPEIIKTLSRATGRSVDDYKTALKDPTMLGLPAAAKGNAEGYLFPSTYEFERNTTAAEQLHMMVARSLEELGRLDVPPNQVQRVLTIASIVEAEARANKDRPRVARVIENRLAMPMPLQMDSTVHFISGRRGKVGTTNAERRSRSPYNTYRVEGLPPGPINSPGLLAMKAAVNPAPGRWIYFVAVNPETGETRFAVDAAGHAANEKLFKQWCSDHRNQC